MTRNRNNHLVSLIGKCGHSITEDMSIPGVDLIEEGLCEECYNVAISTAYDSQSLDDRYFEELDRPEE